MTLRSRLHLARFQRFLYLAMLCILAFNIVYLSQRDPSPVVMIYPKIKNPGRFLIPEKYLPVVMQEAGRYGIPLDIAIRLIWEESRWKEDAIGRNENGTFDYGLMQLNSAYFPLKNQVKPWQVNVQNGMEHLAMMYANTGSWRQAVISYNAGLEGGKDPKERTLRYADRIVSGRLD